MRESVMAVAEKAPIRFDEIPNELKQLQQWVVWRYQPGANGKLTKVPYSPSGRKASSTDPKTWASLASALAAYETGGFDGIGIVLTSDTGLVAWDLDECIDAETGELLPWATDLVTRLNSYTEITPSGKGLRVIHKGTLPVDGRRRGPVEVYQNRRYITVTGRRFPGTPSTIEKRQDECMAVFYEYFPQEDKPAATFQEGAVYPLEDWELIAKAHEAENGETFRRLWAGDTSGYPSASEADLALCNLLAFWAGGDPERIDRLFRQSGLYREKWERADYRERTIAKALAGTATVYNPDRIGGLKDREQPRSVKPTDFTDVGQATVLARECRERLRYTPATGWLYFDGKVWIESETRAQSESQRLTDRQLEEARSELREARAKLDKAIEEGKEEEQAEAKRAVNAAEAYRKYALARRSSRQIANTLKEARPMLEIDVRELDHDPYLLNTPTGTVDLRTGQIKPHDPWDYCTKMTAVEPSDKGAELWAEHLRTITCGDKELEDYLQLTAGMSAVGKVFEEKLLIAYGSGRNGKSTHYNTIARVLGDYAGGLSADVLTVDSRSNKKPEYAELRGKRLVIAAELEEGKRLDTAAVKRLCSIDPIRAEKKYQQPFDFIPSHTIVLHTNHLPQVGTTDEGTWRRLMVIPFNAVIPANNDIKNYADFLFEAAGGAVLAWIIEGAKRFIEAGHTVTPPDSVLKAVEEYRAASDWLSEFISTCCEIGEGYQQPSGELYQAYRDYCAATRSYVRHAGDFKAAVERAGFRYHRTNSGVIVHGLRLRPQAERDFSDLLA